MRKDDWITQQYVREFTTTREPLTAEFLMGRGTCCGNGCTNCPYIPKHIKGNSTVSETIYTK